MARRKNTKRIDPRYFLNETTYRDLSEEIEAVMQEQGGDEMAQVEELAAVFQKSPAIMAAVEQAAQDPQVQAAAQEALAQSGTMQEDEDPMGTAYQKRADRAGMGTAAGAGIGLAGTAAMFAPGALALVGQAAAGTAVAALGFTAGPALMAIGMILMMKMDSAEGENRGKAEMPHLRKRTDFSDEEYRKMYNKD